MDEKFRHFVLLLYPDDESHFNAIKRIQESDYDYALILHDKDIAESQTDTYNVGDIKKAHFHIVLSFKNARRISTVADELGIKENYIRFTRSLSKALLYLIHYEDKDKYQYSIDSVSGSLVKKLKSLIHGHTEENDVINIVKIIDSYNSALTYRELLICVCDNGLYSTFRRMGYGIKILLDDHNKIYQRKEMPK